MSGIRRKLLNKFHRRLQFVILLVIFFPTLFNALYGISGEDLSVGSTVLSWSVILIMLVVVFIVAELLVNSLTETLLAYSNGLLLMEVIALIPLMSIFVFYADKPLSELVALVLKFFITACFAIPLVLMTLVIVKTSLNEEINLVGDFLKNKVLSMNKKSYYQIVSAIFLIVGLLHLLRVLNGWEAVIGGVAIPAWFSWVAVALTFYLAFRGFSFASKLK